MATDNPYNPYNPYSDSNPYGQGNPYQNPYQNPYNNPYNNPYQNPYQHNPYMATPYGQGPQDEEDEGMNINLREWLIRIVHYWYLFVIAAALAYGVACLLNRKWIEEYESSGSILIKDQGATLSGSATLMQGFGIEPVYKNINNQLVLLGSYDLLSRVIDSIPFLQVDYYTRGRFKTRNLYRNTPIILEPEEVNPSVVGLLFRCTFNGDGTMLITSTDNKRPYEATVRYGERLVTPLFTATFWPSEHISQSGQIYFRFRSKNGLVNEFQQRMSMDFVMDGSSVLQLTLRSETPDRDCEFINKLAEIYLLQNLERKNQVADKSIAFINSQLEALQGSLEESEGAMTNFRQQNKFMDVGSYAGQLMGRLSGYDQTAMELRLKETYLDYLTDYLKQSIEDGTIASPSSLGLTESSLSSLVGQLNELQLQRGELSEKNVYYAKLTNDINNVKITIEEVVKSMRATLEIEKADLEKRYKEVEVDMKRLPEKELQMVSIERNYRIDDNYYTFFLQKRAEAEIQKASNTPDNEVMDRARPVFIVNLKAKKKTTMTCIVIGLLIPLLLIILSELLNDKIRTRKEAEQLSVFRLIGTIRHAKSQNPTLVKSTPRSTYAEMLRTIRTRIEFITGKKAGISMAITSTESGDGRTFLSTNLAALYAMTGKKTILIDLDIRKPNIHVKLGLVDREMGMTNYLNNDCSLEDILIKDSPFDFDIIPAGTVPPNPGELIHSDKLSDLLNKLKAEYDYVIIDTSPIGQVPDAYSIIEQTDLTLFVIRCLQTSKRYCKQILEQLAVDHRSKINLILSDIPTEGFHRGYGYGYGYGSNTGYGYGYGNGYGYGGGYGYAGGYAYNGGYGDKKNWRYRYGKYYGKLFRQDQKSSHHYYMEEEEDEENR